MVSPSTHVIWKVLGDEAVFLDTLNGEYYLLNETGSRIWALLSEGKSKDTVAETVASEFQTTFEIAKADIDELLDSLAKSGIIESAE